jgi:DNA-binding XRE family transcriptional regulator
METRTPAQRLRFARWTLNLQQEDFGAPIGVSKAAISRYETEASEITLTVALALEHVFRLNAAWLLEKKGAMWIAPPSAKASKGGKGDFVDRPLISGATSCGPGGEIHDPGPAAERFALRRVFVSEILQRSGGGSEQDLFFLRCSGDSMRPTLLEGEIVLLNAALGARLQPRPNGIYLVRRAAGDTETRVKRLRLDVAKQELVLSSDNRAYAPLTVDLDGTPLHQLILGRVCWVSRDLLEADPPVEDW